LVKKHCAGAPVISTSVLDPMLATVRGVGFEKDFKDLVLKRPPYATELRIRLEDGTAQAVTVNEAFEPFDWRLSYQTVNPARRIERVLESGIDECELLFISPNGEIVSPGEDILPRDAFRGQTSLNCSLDIRGRVIINGLGLQAPYFSQLGLRPPKPYSRSAMALPEVYPAEN